MSRVACETSITTGLVLVMGEITTNAYVDIQKIVRDTVREIGYTRGKYGFDADTCAVITAIDERNILDILYAIFLTVYFIRICIYKKKNKNSLLNR